MRCGDKEVSGVWVREENNMKYPAIDIRNAETDIITDSQGNEISSVLDYWKWAHSCLIDNAERGAFAEYLVACAIGGKGRGRVNWDKYDLVSEEGITVEVKTSAYLQAWGQNALSTLRFGIAKTHGYNPASNSYEPDMKRQAQVYVFCVHAETEQEKVNVLDTTQWKFYVLASKVLDESKDYADANSIGLGPLLKLGAVECGYEELHEVVKGQAK